MKFFILILLIGCFSCKIIQDDTPSWVDNNRYAIELSVNCNGNKTSLGLSGCSYKGDIPSTDYIRINPLWSSRIELTSTKCSSKTFNTYGNMELKIPISSLYDNENGENCSFKIHRYVKFKKKMMDKSMMGRLFIKIVPNNYFHGLLKISILNKTYKGVGWIQKKHLIAPPNISIVPQGSSGTFILRCGDDTLIRHQFTKSPFEISIPEGNSCDMEMAAINADVPEIEFATLMYEENDYTEDIRPPRVYNTKDGLAFSFEDNLNKDRKQMVIGVKVDGVTCTKKYRCTAAQSKQFYSVRAITSTLRYFYGVYNSNDKTWTVY